MTTPAWWHACCTPRVAVWTASGHCGGACVARLCVGRMDVGCLADTVGRSVQALRVWKSHSSPVASVSWRPQSDFHVASVAHDGLLRLWDMRSPVPLVTFDDCSGSKLLAAAWGWRDGGMAVATGGEDSKLRVYDAPGPGGLIKEPDAA